MAVAAAGRVRRPDILFALPVALAADRLSTDGWAACGPLRRADETDPDRRLDRHRLAVLEICRDAVPLKGKGHFRARRIRHRVDRDDIGRSTLRPGADGERRALSVSRPARRAPLLPPLRSSPDLPLLPLSP